MPIFELFAPSMVMAFDLFSLQRSFLGFIASLLLPGILLVVLANAMGGNGQNVAEALGDALAACLVITLELFLRLGKTLCLGFICLLSGLCRIAISYKINRGIKLKTGPEPGNGDNDAGLN